MVLNGGSVRYCISACLYPYFCFSLLCIKIKINGQTNINKILGLQERKSEVYIKPTSHKSSDYSALGQVLRIIGFLNIIGGFIVGINLCGEDCLFGNRYSANGWGIILFVISGIIGCIICLALAKCVDAATKYLKS